MAMRSIKPSRLDGLSLRINNPHRSLFNISLAITSVVLDVVIDPPVVTEAPPPFDFLLANHFLSGSMSSQDANEESEQPAGFASLNGFAVR